MSSQLRREKIWDPITRLWHWAIAASVIVGWCFGEFRSFSTIQWHFYLGYTTGGLLVFRYLWGFVGPTPVRHATLLKSTPQVFSYTGHLFTRNPSGTPGHNPLGVLSVISIMLVLTFQVTTGLFSEDDGLFSSGPLASEVADGTVRQLTKLHHIGAKAIMVLVGLHVAAMVFYQVWKRENLIAPMLTGFKWVRRNNDS